MRRVPVWLLSLLFVFDLYRAFTQSITHDEALTWRYYVVAPFDSLTTFYDANHHILHTYLARLVTGILGTSEFTLRIPALAATALYFRTILHLGRRTVGEGWQLILFVLLLAANPLVMDFEVAARGYGMAVALLFFGCERILAFLDKPERKTAWTAAAALGLAVMANLTVAVPVALAALFLLLEWPRPAKGSYWVDVAGPLAACGLLFLVMAPISQMGMDKFYVGEKTLGESLAGLMRWSLAHNAGLFGINPLFAARDITAKVAGWGLWPLAMLAGLYLGWRARTAETRMLRLVSTLAAGSWLILIAAHAATGMLFPVDRTGLYLLPLFGWLLALLAQRTPVALGVGVLFAASYLVQLNASHFAVWPYNADTRDFLEELNRRGVGRKPPLTVGMSWQLHPATVFYQETRNWRNFAELVREEVRPGLDAYLYIPNDRGWEQQYRLKPERTGPVSQVTLAVPAN